MAKLGIYTRRFLRRNLVVDKFVLHELIVAYDDLSEWYMTNCDSLALEFELCNITKKLIIDKWTQQCP